MVPAALAAVALASGGGSPPPSLAEAARLSFAGEKQEALRILEQVPFGEADRGTILMWRADLALDLLDIDQAAELYRARLRQAPQDRHALAQLLEALQLGGRIDQALSALEQYLKAPEPDAEVQRVARSLRHQLSAVAALRRAHRLLGILNAATILVWLSAFALLVRWAARAPPPWPDEPPEA